MLYLNTVGKGRGYSGAKPSGYNNPDMQAVRFAGPIPRGTYKILPPVDTDAHGPYVMALMPDPETELFGRSGFLIHGDSIHAPGTASLGCVVLDRPTREKIWRSDVHTLLVVRGPVMPSDEETQ